MIDPKDFRPRYAIVTGGSSGIGQSTCIALAEMGLDIGFTYNVHAKEALKTAEEIRRQGQRAIYRHADFANLPESANVIDELAEELGGVDILVANAGRGDEVKVIDFDFDKWRHTLAVNLDAPALYMHKAAVRMKKQGRSGRIIVITCVHERVADPSSLAYTEAKHALGCVVKTMALELTPRYGITVNVVAPGEISTRINSMSDQDADQAKNPRPAVPLGRPGNTREVADVVAFLASVKISFVTGASWRVDGGFEIMTPLAEEFYRDQYLRVTK